MTAVAEQAEAILQEGIDGSKQWSEVIEELASLAVAVTKDYHDLAHYLTVSSNHKTVHTDRHLRFIQNDKSLIFDYIKIAKVYSHIRGRKSGHKATESDSESDTLFGGESIYD